MSDVDWNNIKADDTTIINNKGEEINIEIKKAFENKEVVGHYASHPNTGGVVVPPQKVGTPEGKDEVVIPLDKIGLTIKDSLNFFNIKFPKKMIYDNQVVKYALVDPTMPEIKKATDGSAAMDLYNRLDETIPPFAMGYKIPLNIKLDLNSHWWVLLAARSSFAMKHGLMVANSFGIIDSDYKDELALLVFNPTSEIKKIPKGTRIAQMIFMPTTGCPMQLVKDIESNPDHKGFGSTS